MEHAGIADGQAEVAPVCRPARLVPLAAPGRALHVGQQHQSAERGYCSFPNPVFHEPGPLPAAGAFQLPQSFAPPLAHRFQPPRVLLLNILAPLRPATGLLEKLRPACIRREALDENVRPFSGKRAFGSPVGHGKPTCLVIAGILVFGFAIAFFLNPEMVHTHVQAPTIAAQ
jgi:hypothetical protein